MSCLCVAPLPLRKNCRATAWRMIVFTSAPAGLFVERAHFTGDSVVLQRYFEITSYQDILPLKKTKKNLLLSIWPLTPTHASGLFSKPFWLYLRISWDHFSSGCVSLVWTPLLAVLHQLRVCVCVCVCVWIALQSACTMCAEPNRIRTFVAHTVAHFHTTDG